MGGPRTLRLPGFPLLDLVLMDIDLGEGTDGTVAAAQMLAEREMPIVFLSSHTDPHIVEKTRGVCSYGYVTKDSCITVLDASIRMAFQLFEARRVVQEKEHVLRCVIDSFDDIVFTLDTDLRYTAVYGKWLEENGIEREVFVGRTVDDLVDAEAAEIHNAVNRRALNGERVLYRWPSTTSVEPRIWETGVLRVGRNVTDQHLSEVES